jgi:hypothetical protein
MADAQTAEPITAGRRTLSMSRSKQLYLSPQCGFSSTVEGNVLTYDEEVAELQLIVDPAADVWGRARNITAPDRGGEVGGLRVGAIAGRHDSCLDTRAIDRKCAHVRTDETLIKKSSTEPLTSGVAWSCWGRGWKRPRA